MLKLTKRDIRIWADEQGLPSLILAELDYRLVQVIKMVYADSFLAERLYLKGGTAISELPRPDGRSFVRRVLSNDSWQPYSPRAIHPPTTSYPCGFRSYFEDLIALFSTRYIAPSSQIIILPMI